MRNLFCVLYGMLFCGFLNAQQNTTTSSNISLITNFEIPEARTGIAKIVDRYHAINELFEEFKVNAEAYDIVAYRYRGSNITIIEYFGSETDFRKNLPYERWTFEYNNKGELLKLFNDGPDKVTKILYTFTYNSQGRITGAKNFVNDKRFKEYGKAISNIEYTYDTAGRLVNAIEFYPITLEQKAKTSFFYDVDGLLSERLQHNNTSKDTFRLIGQKIFKYQKGALKTLLDNREIQKDSAVDRAPSIEATIGSKYSFKYKGNAANWVTKTVLVHEEVNNLYFVEKPLRVIQRSYVSAEEISRQVQEYESKRLAILKEKNQKETAERLRKLNAKKRAKLETNHAGIGRLYVIKDFSKPTNSRGHRKLVKKHLFNTYLEIYDLYIEKTDKYDQLLYLQDALFALYSKDTKVLEKKLRKLKSEEGKLAAVLGFGKELEKPKNDASN